MIAARADVAHRHRHVAGQFPLQVDRILLNPRREASLIHEIDRGSGAGVPFRIIAGVTSGLAALVSASVPATMRSINQALILATGQGASDEDGLDWAALARTGQPLVIYMAMQKLDVLCATLMDAGLAATTPAAIVEAATSAEQRALVSTLHDLPAVRTLHRMGSPAVVIVGDVVGLALRKDLLACVEPFVTNAA